MQAVWIVLGALGGLLLLLVLLLLLRVWVSVCYNGEFSVSLHVLFLSFRLFPKKEKWKMKDHLPDKKAGKPKKQKKKAKKKKEKPKKKASLRETLSFYKRIATEVALPAAKQLKKHLQVRIKKLKIDVGSEDPAKTAIVYGAASGAADTLLGFFASQCDFKAPKKENIFIKADFLSEETTAEADLRFGLRLWQAIVILLPALMKYGEIADSRKETSAKTNIENKENDTKKGR